VVVEFTRVGVNLFFLNSLDSRLNLKACGKNHAATPTTTADAMMNEIPKRLTNRMKRTNKIPSNIDGVLLTKVVVMVLSIAHAICSPMGGQIDISTAARTAVNGW